MADQIRTIDGFDVDAVRLDFPILERDIDGASLVYLDSASSAQKPRPVLAAMSDFMTTSYANVHRGLYTLADEATTRFEQARGTVRGFLNAADPSEIIFTKNGTEAVNLVAAGLAKDIKAGDEILLSIAEHHANIIPWHFLRERMGAVLKWVAPDSDGMLDAAHFIDLIGPRTKMVALTHMSNVLGTVPDVAPILQRAHETGIPVLLDGCQAAAHRPIDVQALGVDYYVLTGHKIYGPTGIGVLYGRSERLEILPPYQGGGEMIDTVSTDQVNYQKSPYKFEAGTPPIVQAVGLAAALDWLGGLDGDDMRNHEKRLHDHAVSALDAMSGIRIHGRAPDKGPIASFSADNAHPHDIAQILDRQGIAVRAGHHCAQPLMAALGQTSTARASFAAYNTLADVDHFIHALDKALHMLRMN